jgi:probable rRNA maturation factor
LAPRCAACHVILRHAFDPVDNARLSRVAGLRLSLQQPDGRHRATLTRARVMRWLRAALAEMPAEITLRIVDEEEARTLNRAYRKKDYATNVLTFDYQSAPVVVADVILCAAVVAREAREQRKPLEAHYAHLVVHGTLHALGFDHERAADAKTMEARELSLLAALGFADPYRAVDR